MGEASSRQMISKMGGPEGERDSFGKRWHGLTYRCSSGVGEWLTPRQVAQAHGCLAACSGNVNRIGLKGARNEDWFHDSILKQMLRVVEGASAECDVAIAREIGRSCGTLCARCKGSCCLLVGKKRQAWEDDIGQW